ncbi:hypothetical protein Btru_006498 [Bulinus truncatus]|nr:hypothetical protein Btru_006498 [Bulinus truncatus]
MEESVFLRAARDMEVATVHRLIELGENLDQQNSSGETALIIVCKNVFIHKYGSRTGKIFTELLDMGADPNIRDALGRTAIMHATMSLAEVLDLDLWSADKYVLEKLTLSGADIRLKDNFGRSALDLDWDSSTLTNILYEIMVGSCFLDAVKDLKTDTVFRLLKQEESLDQRNSSGETALIIVAKDSTVHIRSSAARKIFTELINYGADPNIRDALGKTALMHATMSLSKIPDRLTQPTDLNALEMLIMNGADVSIKDNNGESALDMAWNSSTIQSIDILLDAYKNLDEIGTFFTSIKMGRFDFCLRHIRSCPDLTTKDEEGNTLLMLTVKYFNFHQQKDPCLFFKLCEKIILFGADLNVQNERGETALILLFSTNQPFEDTWLLNLFANDGAELDLKDINGNTALIHAMNSASEKSVFWLLAHGANPYIGSKNSRTLINFIAGSDNSITCMHINRIVIVEQFDLMRLLVSNGVIDVNSATLHHTMGIAESLYNLPDAFMNLSPFMFALIQKRLAIAKFLLANCYLTPEDLRFRPGHSIEAFLPQESTVLLQELHSQPWPLGKLAFVAVSGALGSYPERINRIESLKIPQRLKSMLNFQDLPGSLCIDEWTNISIYSRDYDTVNAGRPLLYYWPCGKSSFLVKKQG